MTCSFSMNLRVLGGRLRSWRYSKKTNLNFRNTTYVGQNANRRLPWGQKRPPKKSCQGRWASRSLPKANLALFCWFLLLVCLLFTCFCLPTWQLLFTACQFLFTACQILICWFATPSIVFEFGANLCLTFEEVLCHNLVLKCPKWH